MSGQCTTIGRTAARARPAVMLLALAGFAAPALADPFAPDAQGWMSPGQYLAARAAAPAGDAVSPAASPAVPSAPASAPQAPDKAALAAPARPLNIPFLATRSRNPAIRIDSTADIRTPDDPVTAPPPDAAPAAANQPWRSVAAAIASDTAQDRSSGDALAVRLSFLPDASMHQQPTPDYVSGSQLARKTLEEGHGRQARRQDAPPAACAAIDAFQQKQLKDLQSDRQTLQALRSAVTSMGLEKQLSYLTDPDGSKADGPKPPAAN